MARITLTPAEFAPTTGDTLVTITTDSAGAVTVHEHYSEQAVSFTAPLDDDEAFILAVREALTVLLIEGGLGAPVTSTPCAGACTSRTVSPGESCPSFHRSPRTTVTGQTNPPRLGPSGPSRMGVSPVKSSAPMLYAVS